MALLTVACLFTSCATTVVEPLIVKEYDWAQAEKICVVGVSNLDQSEEVARILTHQLFEMGFPVTQKKAKTVLELYDVSREAKADVVAYGHIKRLTTTTRKTTRGSERTKEIQLSLQFIETETHNCLWKGLGTLAEDAKVKDEYIMEELISQMAREAIPRQERRQYAYEGTPALNVGDKAPLFTVSDVEGKTYALEKHLERNIVVIGFWSLLCKPCKTNIDVLNSIYRRYQSKGVSVVAVSLEGKPMLSRIKSHIYKEGFKFTFLLDEPAEEGYAVTTPYKATAAPAVYVVGKSGNIVFAGLGAVSFGELVEAIELEMLRD
jgi:peroxiredoxin